jgi:hypothetical protein
LFVGSNFWLVDGEGEAAFVENGYFYASSRRREVSKV